MPEIPSPGALHAQKTIAALALLLILCAMAAQAAPQGRILQGTQVCRTFSQNSLQNGYQLFQNSCKTCHFRGNPQGAPFLHSESKTPRGWDRVFFERYPKCAEDGSWAKLSDEDLLRLNDSLYRNAAGAYAPCDAESCG